MDAIGAMTDTMGVAYKLMLDGKLPTDPRDPCSYRHLSHMHNKMGLDTSFSEAKQSRWLAYAQGVVVALGGISTLERQKLLRKMKLINKRHSK